MSASRLKANLSSDYIAASNALRSKAGPIRIPAYVESYEDISFWQNTLHEYETPKIKFDVQTTTKKGKEQVLEKHNEVLNLPVGKYLIGCVDSDYDYLLQDRTPKSKLINESNFIFQTYSYSIENLLCFSESLRLLCGQATKHDKEVVDFNLLLKEYSRRIHNLFIWNVYFRMNDDHQTFTISDFCKIIKLIDKVDVTDNCVIAMTSLQNRVTAKISVLEKDHPIVAKKVTKIAESLKKLGVDEDNTYLFIHGHTLKENVVLKMLEHACNIMIREKFNEIKNNAAHETQALDDMNHYEKQKQPVALVLNLNTEYKSCFLYQKIKIDLDNYVATLS